MRPDSRHSPLPRRGPAQRILRSGGTAVAIWLLTTAVACAWGTGHHYQGELLMDLLPQDLSAFLEPVRAALLVNTKYPDQRGDFKDNPAKPAGFGEDWKQQLEGDFEIVRKHGFGSNYQLGHTSRGKAVMLILLQRAFRDRHPERAALWIAAICHGVGDESAFNHGPLIHYLNYAFRPQGVAMSRGVGGLDLVHLKNHPDGPAIVAARLPSFAPRPVAETPEDALIELMLTGAKGNAYMVQREQALAWAFIENPSGEQIEAALGALADAGLYGARETVRAAIAAWEFADQGVELELTDAVMERFEVLEAEFLANRPLEHDSIYTGLLDGVPGSKRIGVLLEPSLLMNRTLFGFGSKYLQSGIMRTLKEGDIPYTALDVRKVAAGLPPPLEVPVIVVCGGSFRVNDQVRAAFVRYVEDGGQLLWIGGANPGLLGPLSRALRDVKDETLLPVRRRYGDTPERFEEVVRPLVLRFSKDFPVRPEDSVLRFIRNPNTRGGWQKPYCGLQLIPSEAPSIQAWVTIEREGKEIVVAGAWEEAGRIRHAFLPEYLIPPFLFSESARLENPAKPQLDEVGGAVVLMALKQLAPEIISDRYSAPINP